MAHKFWSFYAEVEFALNLLALYQNVLIFIIKFKKMPINGVYPSALEIYEIHQEVSCLLPSGFSFLYSDITFCSFGLDCLLVLWFDLCTCVQYFSNASLLCLYCSVVLDQEAYHFSYLSIAGQYSEF